jgi:hypothetical protein
MDKPKQQQHYKPLVQISLLILGLLFIVIGAYRGEVGSVLAKAIRLCLECVGIG